jgi:L-amino acid N-acyltransferase YncA
VSIRGSGRSIDKVDTTPGIHRIEASPAGGQDGGMTVPAIRLATDDDAPALARIYAPYVEDGCISFEAVAPDAAEMAQRRRAVATVAPWLVLAIGGAVVGYAYAARHRERAAYRWAVDVSVYIDRDHHRRGAGAALYRALLAMVRAQGFYLAHAGITLPNASSVGLHEALGVRLVGIYGDVGWKHGAWRDVGWWRLPLRAPAGEPAEPRPPADMAGDPAWDAALAAPVRMADR